MKKLVVLISIVLLAFCGGSKPTSTAPGEDHDQGHQASESTPDHKDKPEEATHIHGNEGMAHEGEEHVDITIPPEKQKEWGIITGSPLLQNVSSRITLPGSLSLNSNRTAYITSFVRGQISDLSADLGTKVRRGQALVTINSPDFGKAQADFLQTRAALNHSQQEYERAKMLREEKAIEEREYLRRKAEYEELTTELGALESALHSYGITHAQIDSLIAKSDALKNQKSKSEIADPNLPIRSPIAGTVIFRDAILGAHIEPEKILFTVSDLDRLWAILDAYEKDIPYISKDSGVYIISPLYPEKTFPGKITYISETIDEKLRTVKVRVEVPNSEGLLKPNMYIQGILENRTEGKDILTVPDEAIQNLDGKKIVFVMESKDVFTARQVRTGNKVDDRRIITEGLDPRDHLILKGAFTIKTELTKGTFTHQHVH